MSWIKVKTTLTTEPAVSAIASQVKRPENHVVGCLVAVWSWADNLTADGFVQHANLSLIDKIAGVKGFGSAMCSVDWLRATDGGVTFPRWERHNGQSAKARAGEADRKRMQRAEAKCPDKRPDVQRTNVSTRGEEIRREKKTEDEEEGGAIQADFPSVTASPAALAIIKPPPPPATEVSFPWDLPQQLGEAFWRGARYHFQLKAEYLFQAFEAIKGRKLKYRDKARLAAWPSILWSELESFIKARETRPYEDDRAPTWDGWFGHEEDREGDLAWLKAHGITLTTHRQKVLGSRLVSEEERTAALPQPASAPKLTETANETWTLATVKSLKDSYGVPLWPSFIEKAGPRQEDVIAQIDKSAGRVPLSELKAFMESAIKAGNVHGLGGFLTQRLT